MLIKQESITPRMERLNPVLWQWYAELWSTILHACLHLKWNRLKKNRTIAMPFNQRLKIFEAIKGSSIHQSLATPSSQAAMARCQVAMMVVNISMTNWRWWLEPLSLSKIFWSGKHDDWSLPDTWHPSSYSTGLVLVKPPETAKNMFFTIFLCSLTSTWRSRRCSTTTLTPISDRRGGIWRQIWVKLA